MPPAPPDRKSTPPPSDAVQLFFLLACQRGCITETQCSILKGMTGNTMDLDGLLSLIALWNIEAKHLDEMRLLANDIKNTPADGVQAQIRDLQHAPPRLIAAVPLELQWFCYLAIRQGMMTREQCIELDAELGRTRDFLEFAQAVVVLLPKEKFPAIQELVETSIHYANTGRPPPTRVFDAAVSL